jgi:hypothetical protein
VLAVGHSYGGAMITNAATNANNVVGPVYVAAFVRDEGETLADIESDSKESVLKTLLMQLQYPSGQGEETAVEFAILESTLPVCTEVPRRATLGSSVILGAFLTIGAPAPVGSVEERRTNLCHSLIQTEYASSTMTWARVSLPFCVYQVGVTLTQFSNPWPSA